MLFHIRQNAIWPSSEHVSPPDTSVAAVCQLHHLFSVSSGFHARCCSYWQAPADCQWYTSLPGHVSALHWYSLHSMHCLGALLRPVLSCTPGHETAQPNRHAHDSAAVSSHIPVGTVYQYLSEQANRKLCEIPVQKHTWHINLYRKSAKEKQYTVRLIWEGH